MRRNQFTTNDTVNSITLGSGASAVTISATNGAATSNASLNVSNLTVDTTIYQAGARVPSWSTWTVTDTNHIFVTNCGTVAFNGSYTWTNNSYIKDGGTRTFTNMSGGWWCGLAPTFAAYSNTVLFSSQSVWKTNTATTLPVPDVFPGTNALWAALTSDGGTNYVASLTNGASGLVTSNGTVYLITSRIGATNNTHTKLGDAP